MCGGAAAARLVAEEAAGWSPAHPAEGNVRMSMNWLEGMGMNHDMMEQPGQPVARTR
jgi:hypothetical protein